MPTLPSRVLVAAGVLLTAACASSPQAAPSTPAPSGQTVAPAADGRSMVATLTAVSSPITGRVRLDPTGRADQVRATVEIRGAAIGAEMPWQIRQGQCGVDGPEVGPQAAYRVLSARADGTADVRVTLPIAMPANDVYQVRVLLSRSQPDRVVACGVLSMAQ